tara:strand:- start:936 stop:1874 length:939 start_codon:yes stop_codon:yes gene_type:complete
MNAIIFPGQGSQVVGMGLEFYNNFEIVKKIFQLADQKLDFKISKLILEGPDNELKLTKNTQPAILTVSFAIFTVLKKEFNFDFEQTKFFAGHSLGEYSALVSSNSLEFSDALSLVYKRGQAMQEAVPIGAGGMLAVLGQKISDIEYYLKDISPGGICEIANDNAEGQTIVSGNSQGIDELKKILIKNKKRTIPLSVSAPFHCSLMKPAASQMEELINKTKFNIPSFQIISNVTSLPIKDPEEIKKLLIQQIFSTVKWRESIINISKSGVNNFFEIGPGKVLTGMVKRTLKDINCFSLNSINDMKNIPNEFKK